VPQSTYTFLFMEDYKKFLLQFRTKHFNKGEIILVQGEEPDCAFIVKSGIIKSYNLTMQGEEKPIGFDKTGEVFPIGWVFGKVQQANYYYEAFTACDLYCIPVSKYRKFVEAHPKRMMLVCDTFIDRYLGAQMRINALEQSKAAAKVINTIHYLCLRFGEEVKKDVVRIDLPLTQQDLANFVGLTRETTGIELKKLQREGIISYKKRNYIVQTNKLNALLDEDYGQGLLG